MMPSSKNQSASKPDNTMNYHYRRRGSVVLTFTKMWPCYEDFVDSSASNHLPKAIASIVTAK
jgi:hypothetical protein